VAGVFFWKKPPIEAVFRKYEAFFSVWDNYENRWDNYDNDFFSGDLGLCAGKRLLPAPYPDQATSHFSICFSG
jgi:hypothetical protein